MAKITTPFSVLDRRDDTAVSDLASSAHVSAGENEGRPLVDAGGGVMITKILTLPKLREAVAAKPANVEALTIMGYLAGQRHGKPVPLARIWAASAGMVYPEAMIGVHHIKDKAQFMATSPAARPLTLTVLSAKSGFAQRQITFAPTQHRKAPETMGGDNKPQQHIGILAPLAWVPGK